MSPSLSGQHPQFNPVIHLPAQSRLSGPAIKCLSFLNFWSGFVFIVLAVLNLVNIGLFLGKIISIVATKCRIKIGQSFAADSATEAHSTRQNNWIQNVKGLTFKAREKKRKGAKNGKRWEEKETKRKKR